jgi:hypothetical protein
MKQLLEALGINAAYIAAGFFGSVVFAGNSAGLTMERAIIRIATGALVANYTTPLVVELIKLDKFSVPAAFIIGYLGITVLDLLVSKFKPKEIQVEKKDPEFREMERLEKKQETKNN